MDDKTKFLLGKMIGLLGSDQDGEVLAAARSIRRLLESHKLTFGDLVNLVTGEGTGRVARRSQSSGIAHMAELILRNADMMREHEAKFVRDVLARSQLMPDYRLTEKQAKWFSFLFARYGEMA